MPLVIGVDSSTQSVKVEARDLDSGDLVATGSARHPATQPPVSEQDPVSWWAAIAEAMGQLGECRADVVGIAVAGQQHGCVLLDDAGAVVAPAPLWNDTRAAEDATALVDELGADTWARSCGSVPVASFTIAKLAWFARTDPSVLDRVAKVMLPHDYLTWRLTDRHVTDRGDASGTGWFDPASNNYRANLLERVVPDGEAWLGKLPEVAGHDAPVGTLTATAAGELGLPDGVVVGAGTGDNMAGALGLGLAAGDVAMSLGTSGTVYAVSDTPAVDPSGAVAGFADAVGGFLPLVCTLNATKVTDTVAAWLGTDAAGLADLALEADATVAEPVLVPYFDGERTPNRPDATGTMVGLRTSTSREAIARAAHDGVLCGLLDGLDALKAVGPSCDGTVNLIGGGARSSAYRQRCADLLGAPINVPASDETVALGAAVLAARTVSGSAAAASWGLGEGETVEPAADGAAVRAAYREARGESE